MPFLQKYKWHPGILPGKLLQRYSVRLWIYSWFRKYLHLTCHLRALLPMSIQPSSGAGTCQRVFLAPLPEMDSMSELGDCIMKCQKLRYEKIDTVGRGREDVGEKKDDNCSVTLIWLGRVVPLGATSPPILWQSVPPTRVDDLVRAQSVTSSAASSWEEDVGLGPCPAVAFLPRHITQMQLPRCVPLGRRGL